MSEQIHDQVSAFMDDELSAEECAFLVRRFERDPEARSRLVRYSLIGTALRGELLQPEPDMLRRRVADALSGAAPSSRTAAPAMPPRAAAAGARWASPAVGLGVAATVAVAALFTVRGLNDVDGRTDSPVRATALAVPSYIVPGEAQDDVRVITPIPIRLTNYLLHHGEYARLSRTSVHSSVVGATDIPFVADAVIQDDAPAQGERRAR